MYYLNFCILFHGRTLWSIGIHAVCSCYCRICFSPAAPVQHDRHMINYHDYTCINFHVLYYLSSFCSFLIRLAERQQLTATRQKEREGEKGMRWRDEGEYTCRYGVGGSFLLLLHVLHLLSSTRLQRVNVPSVCNTKSQSCTSECMCVHSLIMIL